MSNIKENKEEIKERALLHLSKEYNDILDIKDKRDYLAILFGWYMNKKAILDYEESKKT